VKISQHDDIGGAVAIAECIEAGVEGLYDLGASAYLPSAPPKSGGISVGIRWYGSIACQGGALGGSPTLDFAALAPAAWQRKEMRMIPTPAGAASALVYVSARAETPDTYAMYVDDLALTRSLGAETFTLPTAASLTGVSGQRFQTDLVLHNPAAEERLATLKLYPAGTTGGGFTPVVLRVGPRETRPIDDVIHFAFGSQDRAGALEIEVDPRGGGMQAFARAATVNPERPGYGMVIPVEPRERARSSARFLGLAPFSRVNAGAFNPGDGPVEVTFTTRDASGIEITHVTRTWGPFEWFQINGIANEVSAVEPAASVEMRAASPVFPFVIAIDNRSGDPSFLPALDLVEP
jgi:hypothetical protein